MLRRTRSRLVSTSVVAALAVAGAVTAPLGFAAEAAHPPTIAQLTQQINAAKQQLAALQQRSEVAAERYNSGQIALVKAKQAASEKQHLAAQAVARLAAMRTQVSAFAADMYKNGTSNSALDIVGNAEDPQAFVDRTAYGAHLSQQKSAALAALLVVRHDADVTEQAAKQAVAAQQAVVAQLANDKAQVEQSAKQQEQVLNQLQAKQQELIRAARIAAARAAAARRAAAAAALRRAQEQARQLAAERAATAAAANSFNNGGGGGTSSPPVSTPVAPVGNAAAIAVQWAYREIGKPYVWAAAGPDAFDCSGLTMYVYAKAGIYLGHYTGSQWDAGPHVSISQLQPGDLVFFGNPIHHVGIYVGGGNMIEAPHTGAFVRVSSISRPDYAGAVRVVG